LLFSRKMSSLDLSLSDEFDFVSEGSSSELIVLSDIEDFEEKEPGLLKLPVGIRTQIFEYVLLNPYSLHKVHCEPGDTTSTTFHTINVPDYYGVERTRNIQVPDYFWSLLLVDKQISHEATVCLYQVNNFRFIDNPPPPSYLDWGPEILKNIDIPTRYVHLLRSITMTESYNVDNNIPETLTAFVRDVAPFCTALRYLCLFIPRRILWDYLKSHSTHQSQEFTWVQCFSSMDTVLRWYLELYKGLEVLGNRFPQIDFRFMIGASFSSSHLPEAPCVFPDDGNISSGRVYLVDSSTRFAHLILQLNECAIFLRNESTGRRVCFDFQVSETYEPLDFPTSATEWLRHRPPGYGMWRFQDIDTRLFVFMSLEDRFRSQMKP